MSEQGSLCHEALLQHCQAHWMLFRTFKPSRMWKFTWEPQTLPRRRRGTASKQTELEIYSSDRHRVHQACQWMYLSVVLQVHATPVVYSPLDSDASLITQLLLSETPMPNFLTSMLPHWASIFTT